MRSSGLLVLDVDRIATDAAGVQGFTWPVSHAEVTAMRDATVVNLVSAIRTLDKEKADYFHAFSILLPAFLNEVVNLFQAHALVRRSGKVGIKVTGTRAKFIDALSQHSPIPQSPTLEILAQGLNGQNSRHHSARRVLGDLRRSWQLNGPSLAAIRPLSSTANVMTFQTNLPLIRSHARSTHSFVWYKHPERWFTSLKTLPGIDRSSHGLESIDSLLVAVGQGFNAGNEEITNSQITHLQSWLTSSIALVSHRLAELRTNPNKLPNVLWTGNGTNFWSRMLRHAVRLEGGTVTGHDHGAGSSHLSADVASFAELESCDTFVTFTDTGAAALRQKLQPTRMINDTTPNIIALDSKVTERRMAPHTGFHHNSRANHDKGSIKTIMYPGSFYRGGFSYGFGLGLPDAVALDWEARLFSKLNGWGFEVLHKPHPGSVSLPGGLAESFGGRTITDRFERVMGQADAFVLFPTLQSTTTPLLLASSKPTVYVDADLFPLTKEAYELLSRRCAIVPGWLDDENRVQIEWSDLRSAIELSRNLADTSIVDYYWGNRWY